MRYGTDVLAATNGIAFLEVKVNTSQDWEGRVKLSSFLCHYHPNVQNLSINQLFITFIYFKLHLTLALSFGPEAVQKLDSWHERLQKPLLMFCLFSVVPTLCNLWN